MFRLNGLGPDLGDGKATRVLVLAPCSGPVLVSATITGAKTVTTTRRTMHLVYAFNATQRRPSRVEIGSETADPQMEVRFDCLGGHVLNHPGTLYLADGDPSDVYEIEIQSRSVAQALHWHQLTAVVPAGARYTLPKFHSRLRCAGAMQYDEGPAGGVISASPTFAAAEAVVVNNSTFSQTLFSEWFG